MTYAYAMVLENGTHISSQQPLISVTLKTPNGVLVCASPSYYLPTFNNVSELNGRGATLDSATAISNGFRVSLTRSPNANPNGFGGGVDYLQDVWTKNWTEVTYDLSPYRGQDVVSPLKPTTVFPVVIFHMPIWPSATNVQDCRSAEIQWSAIILSLLILFPHWQALLTTGSFRIPGRLFQVQITIFSWSNPHRAGGSRQRS
ncbi:MAG: hypothetical protein WDM78_05890 [Puia sp.]